MPVTTLPHITQLQPQLLLLLQSQPQWQHPSLLSRHPHLNQHPSLHPLPLQCNKSLLLLLLLLLLLPPPHQPLHSQLTL
jgi:hypothetical protein